VLHQLLDLFLHRVATAVLLDGGLGPGEAERIALDLRVIVANL